MNQRQLASVLFAVVGVFIALSRLPDTFYHVPALLQADPVNESAADALPRRAFAVAALAATALAITVGAGLVLLRDRAATRLFRADTQPLAAPGVHAVALSVLGCYFAVQGASQLLWARQFDWRGTTQLVLGLGLFLGADGLSRLWSLARSIGRSAT